MQKTNPSDGGLRENRRKPPEASTERRVIGLMSGTSADGVDLAYVRLKGTGEALEYEVSGTGFTEFDGGTRRKILEAMEGDAASVCSLNYELAGIYANCVASFLRRTGLAGSDVSLIGLHGQTLRHQHGKATLQVGDGSVVATRLGIPCVFNFRAADIAAGGCGAPLVPLLDRILARRIGGACLFLNLGGVANLTWVPRTEGESVVAFDTGPANAMLDRCASILSRGELRCDEDGRLSAGGRTISRLLEELMAHPYLRREPPKSTGREDFGEELCRRLLERYGKEPVRDVMFTLARFTVESVRLAVQSRFPGLERLIPSGGGVRHPVVREGLREVFAGKVFDFESLFGFHPDFKEALLMALLAHYKMENEPGNLPAATGAERPVVLGVVA